MTTALIRKIYTRLSYDCQNQIDLMKISKNKHIKNIFERKDGKSRQHSFLGLQKKKISANAKYTRERYYRITCTGVRNFIVKIIKLIRWFLWSYSIAQHRTYVNKHKSYTSIHIVWIHILSSSVVIRGPRVQSHEIWPKVINST